MKTISLNCSTLQQPQQQYDTRKSQICGMQQASSFLKKQIGQIIKRQLKAYHIRSQLAAELQKYQKQQLHQKLSKSLLEDKLKHFRSNQHQTTKKQYDLFTKKQQERQQKLRSFLNLKTQQHKNKFAVLNDNLKNVKDRYATLTLQDSNLRLSKIAPFTAHHTRKYTAHLKSQNSRSVSQAHHQTISRMQEERQKHLVTNFLNKACTSESRIVLQQMQKQKRREESLNKKVKCLVSFRKKLEEEHMSKAEKEYEDRMQTFQNNHSRIAQIKSNMLQHRALRTQKVRRKVLQKKAFVIKEQIQGIIDNYNKKGKENILRQYKSTLDLNLSKQNQMNNLLKMESEANRGSLQLMMKVLYKKLQKIKNLGYGQKLDERSIEVVMSLLDKNDPEYSNIVEFLRSERKSFVEAIIKKEEDKNRLEKLKKMGKTPSK